MAKRRRRRNPGGTFFHEHPWMTFFLGMGVLETVRVAVRGWEPSTLPGLPSASTAPATPLLTPAANATPSQMAGVLGLMYR